MAEATLVNCTPHPVNIGSLEIPPSGIVPRLPEETRQVDSITYQGTEIPIVETTYGSSAELPPQRPGVYLIVSAKVALAYPDRRDLLMTGQAIRDPAGKIIGAKNLARVPR